MLKRKCCWLAKQYERGWRLGFCFGNDKTKWIPFWFYSKQDIEKALSLKVVYIFMAKSTHTAWD